MKGSSNEYLNCGPVANTAPKMSGKQPYGEDEEGVRKRFWIQFQTVLTHTVSGYIRKDPRVRGHNTNKEVLATTRLENPAEKREADEPVGEMPSRSGACTQCTHCRPRKVEAVAGIQGNNGSSKQV